MAVDLDLYSSFPGTKDYFPDALSLQDPVKEFLRTTLESRASRKVPGLSAYLLSGPVPGKYHVAVRWCPSLNEHSAEDAAFAEAARYLLQLAGQKHSGGC